MFKYNVEIKCKLWIATFWKIDVLFSQFFVLFVFTFERYHLWLSWNDLWSSYIVGAVLAKFIYFLWKKCRVISSFYEDILEIRRLTQIQGQ